MYSCCSGAPVDNYDFKLDGGSQRTDQIRVSIVPYGTTEPCDLGQSDRETLEGENEPPPQQQPSCDISLKYNNSVDEVLRNNASIVCNGPACVDDESNWQLVEFDPITGDPYACIEGTPCPPTGLLENDLCEDMTPISVGSHPFANFCTTTTAPTVYPDTGGGDDIPAAHQWWHSFTVPEGTPGGQCDLLSCRQNATAARVQCAS